MPSPPAGEADLRALARRFSDVERRVRALVAEAPEGDRRALATDAHRLLLELRQHDMRGPVISAYIAAFSTAGPRGEMRTPKDLAASLHRKLDSGAKTAAVSARAVFATVTAETVEESATAAVTAHIDKRGTRWALGSWAAMNTETIGRLATSRGITDAVGRGGKVTIEVSGCDYCAEFEGEATIGTDALPPFHPHCTCVVSPS